MISLRKDLQGFPDPKDLFGSVQVMIWARGVFRRGEPRQDPPPGFPGSSTVPHQVRGHHEQPGLEFFLRAFGPPVQKPKEGLLGQVFGLVRVSRQPVAIPEERGIRGVKESFEVHWARRHECGFAPASPLRSEVSCIQNDREEACVTQRELQEYKTTPEREPPGSFSTT